MMLFNLVLLATFGGVLCAYNGPLAGGVPAHQYPAGISPEACPNFPNCDNPSLAANPNVPIQKYQLVNSKQAFQPNYQSVPQTYQQQGVPTYQTYEDPQTYQAYQRASVNPAPVHQAPVQQQAPVSQGSFYQSGVAPIPSVPYPSNYVQPTQKQVSRNDPEYTGAYAPKDALDAGEYIGDGDYRGEGLDEAEAFEKQQQQGHRYQQVQPVYQQAQAVQQQAQPIYQQAQPAYQQAQPVYQQAQTVQHQPNYQQQEYQPEISHHHPAPVPAGLDPNACPNYPYCH